MERCFRLALSVDLQAEALGAAVDGVVSGSAGEGQTVTWRGWHLGWRRTHQTLFEQVRPNSYFRERMLRGSFAMYEHEHHFAPRDGGTRMRDEVRFEVPGWKGGRLVEGVVRRHLTELLRRRNEEIMAAASSESWRRYLEGAVARAKDSLGAPRGQ